MITGSLSSAPPSLALSGNNTREHTYSRNERTTEKERESKEGGGQEKEVAYELQGERLKEERERERLCVQLAIRLYRLDGEQCNIRGRGN